MIKFVLPNDKEDNVFRRAGVPHVGRQRLLREANVLDLAMKVFFSFYMMPIDIGQFFLIAFQADHTSVMMVCRATALESRAPELMLDDAIGAYA